MASFNKVILMGNLTRTPELRSTPGGAQVTDIGLAIKDVYVDKAGNKQERVDFVDVTFWGKQAETLCRWKQKGDPLLVEGRLRLETWQDRESGKNRSKLKVIGIGFTFLGRAGGNDGGGGGGNRQQGGNQSQGNQNRGGQQSGPPQQSEDDYGGGYDDYATSLPQGGGEEPPF